ncbi:MAG: carboxypeptidase regulatory-like domain-containing protein [Solirubrobacterales bacterium]
MKIKAWLLATVFALLLVPASAQAAGGVSGVVTAVGGGALSGIKVCAREQSTASQACAATDGSGEYEIELPQAGKYRVKFEGGDDYVDRWFEDASTEAEADVLPISGHLTEGVDGELPPAGQLEGTAMDAVTKAGIANVSACARKGGGFVFSYCASTDSGGSYRLGGLPPGSYTVEFSAGFEPATRDYLHEYYDDSPTEGEATPVTVTAGAVTAEVDAGLTKGAQIAGVVTNEGGEPIAGVSVCAEVAKARPNFGECGFTGSDGTYVIHRLASGRYRIGFFPGPLSGNFLRQYYRDQPSRQLAEAVQVNAPSPVTGIDATLHFGGQIKGQITEEDGATPIQNARACAFETGSEVIEGGGRCAQTAGDGSYVIGSLPSGSYEVTFSAAEQGFASERWNDQPIDEAGTPIAVISGGAATNVNGALSEGGTVRGTVTTAADDSPIQSIEVCAFRGHQEEGRCVFTAASGEYEFRGLDLGSYAIRFRPGTPFGPGAEPSDPNFVTQWYSDQASRGDAQQLDVTAGTVFEEIDAALATGSRISGSVTGTGGVPIPFAFVCAVPSDGGEQRCINADKHGDYTLQGLSDGMYEVNFRAGPSEGSAGWLPQWWNGRATEAEAEELAVSGDIVEEIDANLQAAGGIAGRVTIASSGAPLSDAFVCAFPSGGGEPTNCAEPHPDGTYLIPILPTGSYRVEFSSVVYLEGGETIEEFATQFWKGASSLGAGTLVSVTAGQTTGSIDAAMVEPGEEAKPPDEGGGDQPPSTPLAAQPPLATTPPPASKPVVRKPHCRKIQKLKKVRGKWRCVKKPKPRHHKAR